MDRLQVRPVLYGQIFNIQNFFPIMSSPSILQLRIQSVRQSVSHQVKGRELKMMNTPGKARR